MFVCVSYHLSCSNGFWHIIITITTCRKSSKLDVGILYKKTSHKAGTTAGLGLGLGHGIHRELISLHYDQ